MVLVLRRSCSRLLPREYAVLDGSMVAFVFGSDFWWQYVHLSSTVLTLETPNRWYKITHINQQPSSWPGKR